MDYLFQEWQEKPVGLVSYGGMSGGMRAAQDLKAPITTLGMMPMPQGVAIPFFTNYINDDNAFEAKRIFRKVG